MKKNWTRAVVLLAAVGLAAGLSGCGGTSEAPIGGDIIAPVTMEANELQGASVELLVGQVLNIDTGDLAVDSYRGDAADEQVAIFTQGREDGSAVFNPGIEAISPGKTEVTMTNEQGGIQPLQFTVTVVA